MSGPTTPLHVHQARSWWASTRVGMQHGQLQCRGTFHLIPPVLHQGRKQLYLSLTVCRGLEIVNHNFPSVQAAVGALVRGEVPQTPARPSTPPYVLTEDNVDLLESLFIEHFVRTAFAVNRTPLPEMSGPLTTSTFAQTPILTRCTHQRPSITTTTMTFANSLKRT